MPQDWLEVAAKALPHLRRGDLQRCEELVLEALSAEPPGPFHEMLDERFTNPPAEVAEWVTRFGAAQSFPIAAVYLEMNGFSINPDEWFCDAFAYRRYGGHEDYDWLASMDSPYVPPLVLTGMESVQRVYATGGEGDEATRSASDLRSLLVVVRFQRLVARAAPHIRPRDYPILATAHDYDFISET
jgi:hypothetical protein